jgi:tRNA modification GTPase
VRGDTIAAIATPPGGAARALIRLSGPRAAEIVAALWRGPFERGARGVFRGRVADGRGTQPALLFWMPAPRSFTREDVAELHLPGAEALVRAVLARVLELGARPAEAGEFTRRAFLSGRIDLSRAEGLLELVSASNEAERAAAAELVGGGLARRVEALRAELLDLAALCEASLDFEEADAGHVPAAELEARAESLRSKLDEALSFEGARARRGAQPRVLLAGAPNAGKSTLFNALLGREEALVHELAGTTRDLVRAELELPRGSCLLQDSAGLEAGAGGLGREAQARTRGALAAADAVLWVVEASRGDPDARPELSPATPRLLVWSQIDRTGAKAAPPGWLAVSARTGAGLPELRAALAGLLEAGSGTGGPLRELSLRHASALAEARARLEGGLRAHRAGAPAELLAEDLRLCLRALDEISGASTREDVLDRIFARFCIGK